MVASISRLGDACCAACLCPAISGETEADEAEQHHRPGMFGGPYNALVAVQ